MSAPCRTLSLPQGSRRRAEGGFSLLEVLVAIAIVAIAVFPMLQLLQSSERSAFDAKFTSVACSGMRALLSKIAREAPPGMDGQGDLTDFGDEDGFDAKLAYADILYEWDVQAVDLSADAMPQGRGDEEEKDTYTEKEDKDPLKDADDDEQIDDRFRARYVRIIVFYEMENGEKRELISETYLPPLPKKEDGSGSRSDIVPPNDGSSP